MSFPLRLRSLQTMNRLPIVGRMARIVMLVRAAEKG
jgi:hypothetical protein